MADLLRSRRRKRRRKSRLSPDAKKQRRIQRKFMSDIRTVFVNAGFVHIPTRDTEITIGSMRSDFDGLFLHENVVVISEDTAASDIKDHLRKKAEFYSYIKDGRELMALEAMRTSYPAFDKHVQKSEYSPTEFRFAFVYFSLTGCDAAYAKRYGDACRIADNATLQYFLSLTRTIHKSARYELLKYLGFRIRDIGHATSGTATDTYHGLLLPDVPSGFPPGHRLVSFLASPETLLARSYVLRADSWLDSDALYQRLLIKNKITSMREYLTTNKRVFVNNLIVSLPATTNVTPVIPPKPKSNEMAVVEVVLPTEFDTIGIIDGQHRVFAYHEGDDKFETQIERLRGKQHLLVTGIVYPDDLAVEKAREFEARLFLEINDKQKSVRADLKQAIEVIVNPYSSVAIAKAVIDRLAQSGPLQGKLGVHFFDRGKLKTGSIVGYGLQPLVRLVDTEESLFRTWKHPKKQAVLRGTNKAALSEYVGYAAAEIGAFLSGFKLAHPDIWTEDKKKSRALTTTGINGLIFCLRRIVRDQKLLSVDRYRTRFARLAVSFTPAGFAYKSSHWKKLGDKLFTDCFE